MSHHRSEALTLRSYPYSEAHLIGVFLTRESGQLRSIAYGARSGRKSKFGSGLEPLTHAHLKYSHREGQELAVLRDLEIVQAFPAYELDWQAKLHFAYFAELLQEFTHEGEAAEPVFRLSLAVLGSLTSIPIVQLARYFELWLLRLEGVLPNLSSRLPEELASRSMRFMAKHPRELVSDELTEGELKRLGRLSEELIESHLEKKLKSSRMLKELL